MKALLAIDWSGSIPTDLLKEHINKIDEITNKYNPDIVVFDTEIKKLIVDTEVSELYEYLMNTPRRGGTEYQCVIDYAIENKYDMICI